METYFEWMLKSLPNLDGSNMTNQLFFGDNLSILRKIKDETVDLVYLDPPFNSNATYNVLFKDKSGHESQAQIEAFEDTWEWGPESQKALDEVLHSDFTDAAKLLASLRDFLGNNDMMAYLSMMAVRMLELHRVLKDTGSIYLHCDPTASHYLKLLLDSVFGAMNFRSEIIWRRTGAHNKSERWAPIHDVILFYSKSDNFKWNNPRQPYMKGHVDEHFEKDALGYKTAYYGNVLTGSGTRNGESGQPWKGIDPTAKGRHWAVPGKLWEDSGLDGEGLSQHQKLDLLFDKGLIKIVPGQAWPVYERRVQPSEGPATADIWAYQPYTEGTVFGTDEGIDADASWLKPRSSERLGYPTQKPLGVLERIIRASSDKGDVVLDPFVGGGTTAHAAQKLGRKWIGIDLTYLAIGIAQKRLNDAFPGLKFEIKGQPKDFHDAKMLAAQDKHDFQWWAVSKVDARPHKGMKKGADQGIDGLIFVYTSPKKTEKVIVSVKGGGTGVKDIRDLVGVLQREKAPIGIFLTLQEPTAPMKKEAASAGEFKCDFGTFPRVQIFTIEELFDGKRPKLPPQNAEATHKKTAVETTTEQIAMEV